MSGGTFAAEGWAQGGLGGHKEDANADGAAAGVSAGERNENEGVGLDDPPG